MSGHPLAWAGIAILVTAVIFLTLTGGGPIGPLQGTEIARLAAAVALLIVIGGGIVFSRNFELGAAIRHGIIWLAIMLGLVVAYSYL
jgi:predicted aspartyl protease